MASGILPLTYEDLNKFSAKRYNDLLSAEEADNELKKKTDFKEFLEKVFALTLESKIELGLRLIHKHMPLKEDKAMVEKYTEFNNKPALITSADFVDEKTYPASWLLNEDEVYLSCNNPLYFTKYLNQIFSSFNADIDRF